MKSEVCFEILDKKTNNKKLLTTHSSNYYEIVAYLEHTIKFSIYLIL